MSKKKSRTVSYICTSEDDVQKVLPDEGSRGKFNWGLYMEYEGQVLVVKTSVDDFLDIPLKVILSGLSEGMQGIFNRIADRVSVSLKEEGEGREDGKDC